MNEYLFYFFYNMGNVQGLPEMIYFSAEYFGYFVSGAVFLWIVWRFKVFFIKKAVVAFAVPTFAWIFSHVLKDYFAIPRPFQVFESVVPLVQNADLFQAFPSGHATFFAALATSVYFLDKRIGIAVAACALLIGLARIAAGIHWPADILTGWALGILVALLLNEEWMFQDKKEN